MSLIYLLPMIGSTYHSSQSVYHENQFHLHHLDSVMMYLSLIADSWCDSVSPSRAYLISSITFIGDECFKPKRMV